MIAREEVEADAEIAEKLGVDVGDGVLYVRRLSLADGRPDFVGDSYLPVGRFPGLRDADFTAVSLSGQKTGRKVELTRQWIGSASPADVAVVLELEPGAPVLRLDRVACVLFDLPIESVTAFFHPVRYQHHGELSLRPEGRSITNEELPATRSARRLDDGSKPKPCGYDSS